MATRLKYYQGSLKLRTAAKAEIEWINSCYDQLEFIHSNFENELIAIAEFDDQKSGLGRLVKIDEQHLELGGMYVFENFRNKGIAKEIVKFLLVNVQPSQKVYCIAFEHLLGFYKRCGFTNCSNLDLVPVKILDKFNWCQEKYTHTIALLVLESK